MTKLKELCMEFSELLRKLNLPSRRSFHSSDVNTSEKSNNNSESEWRLQLEFQQKTELTAHPLLRWLNYVAACGQVCTYLNCLKVDRGLWNLWTITWSVKETFSEKLREILEPLSPPSTLSGTVVLIRDDAGTGSHAVFWIREIIRADPEHLWIWSQ